MMVFLPSFSVVYKWMFGVIVGKDCVVQICVVLIYMVLICGVLICVMQICVMLI